jgi:hypothetical protein
VEDFEMAAIDKKEHWARLYRRALFEGDRRKLPLLLEQAHEAVLQRVRELHYSPTYRQDVTYKEHRKLDAAAYYIGLLRSLEAQQQRPCLSSKSPGRFIQIKHQLDRVS